MTSTSWLGIVIIIAVGIVLYWIISGRGRW